MIELVGSPGRDTEGGAEVTKMSNPYREIRVTVKAIAAMGVF